jgi:hypothetical protein
MADAKRQVSQTGEEFTRTLLAEIDRLAKKQAGGPGQKRKEMELNLQVLVRYPDDEEATAASGGGSSARALPQGDFCCVCVKTADGVWHCTGKCC